MSTATAQQLPAVHPAAELFPMMERAELLELARDIKEQGLVDPIAIWQGQVIDGRNRLAACGLAGIAPAFTTIKKLPGGPVAYVLSKNLQRRHLTAPQRAVLGVQAAEMMAGEAAERKREGGRAGGKEAGNGRPKAERSKIAKPIVPKTAARAAKAVGAGEKQVEAMASVKKNAPEVFKAVQSGEVKTVADAKRLAAVEDPKERRAALQLVKSGEPARSAIETVSTPTPIGAPTSEQRMATIARAMTKARGLAENLNHQLDCVITNARKIGVENIGGLGGFRMGVELTALKATLNKLEGMFP